MRSKTKMRLAVCGLLIPMGLAARLAAQDARLPNDSVSINFPKDSPVGLLGSTTGQSSATPRGTFLVINLHMSLSLVNTSANRIHGVTLRVVSQEVAVGGKGSVALPSLNIAPGEAFPVRIDLQLMKPAQMAAGPLAEVSLDGVLFQDLSFYGPDRLDSRRIMTAWEMEAVRDREHFKRVLAQGGRQGLEDAVFASMERQVARRQLQVRVLRGPAATSASAAGPERAEQFDFVKFADSPVEPISGWAQVSGDEARAPRIQVRNTSKKPVKYVELGWLVRENGQQYMAASLPASGPDLYLPAGQTARMVLETALHLSRNGQPLKIQGMTGFVSQVEFSDGKVWVPNRQNLDDPVLRKVLPPSDEEQRLTDIYRKKGLPALVTELKKF